jgi:hypothetical protein
MNSVAWKEGDPITIKIKRGEEEKTLSGKVVLPKVESESYKLTNTAKAALNNAWLRG